MWMAEPAQAGRGLRFAAARREWLLGATHDTEGPRYSAAFLQSVPWYVYAWVDGRVAAGVKFMISQIEAYVEEAFVHTDHRGRRIVAFMLLYAARTFAAGAPQFRLQVSEDNFDARSAYGGVGFSTWQMPADGVWSESHDAAREGHLMLAVGTAQLIEHAVARVQGYAVPVMGHASVAERAARSRHNQSRGISRGHRPRTGKRARDGDGDDVARTITSCAVPLHLHHQFGKRRGA